MNFKNKLNPNTIKDNVAIDWNINTTSAKFINGFSLPDFRIKFTDKLSGVFNLTCSIFYRNNTFAYKKLSRSFIFTIPDPPNVGTLDVFPNYSVTLSETKINLIAEKFLFEDDPKRKNFSYQFFYKNYFGEFLWIRNIYDNPNQITYESLPITDQIKVMVYYNQKSSVETTKNITVQVNSILDYNEIDTIFVYSVEQAIIKLELFAINLRSHVMTQSSADTFSIKVINKLYDIFNLNNAETAIIILYNNIEKIGTILEAATLKLKNYSAVSKSILYVIENTLILSMIGEDETFFNQYYCNNFLRALDNLISIKPITENLESTDIKILLTYKNLIRQSFYNIPKGAYKLANLDNIDILGITIDQKFLKNDMVYFNNDLINPYNTPKPIFFQQYDDIYRKDAPKLYSYEVLSINIPVNIINYMQNDFIILFKNYIKWNKVISDTPANYTKDSWYPVTPDIIEVEIIDIKLVERNITNSNKTFLYRNLQVSNSTTNSTITNKTIQNTNTISTMGYVFNENIYIPSGFVVINFTMKNKFSLDILNKTSCVRIFPENNTKGLHEIYDDYCNTWFDYENNIIQCECDEPGIYSIGYNPYFKYLRKHIQFPQTADSIGNFFYFLIFFSKSLGNGNDWFYAWVDFNF